MPKVPNEKLIETLFNYNALRFLEAEKVTLYAPSTREEFAVGYDSKLMGASGFDELYIQFKTPELLVDNGRSVRTTTHQHARLLHYPPKAAYYVTHTFDEVRQIQELQRAATSPAEFLRRFFAIEANHFEEDVSRLRYYVSHPERPEDINYRRKIDPGKTPVRPVTGWMNGQELLSRFARGEIGAFVRLVGSGGMAEFADNHEVKAPTLMDDRGGETWVMSSKKAWNMAPPENETNWGTAFRKDFVAEGRPI